MPAVSEKQRRFMAAERGRERAGKSTKTHMSDKQLTDFMHKGHAGKTARHHKGHR